MDTQDIKTEVTTQVSTGAPRVSINSAEGQQWMYLSLLLVSLVMIQFFPAVKEQGIWLFGASSGALFAKAKST